jgi:tRNA (guanine-N7-)-methyltransferase
VSPDGAASDAEPRPKSFARRQGRRLRPGRQALMATLLPQLRLTAAGEDATPQEPKRMFPAPVSAVWLEVGFGAGEHLAGQLLAEENRAVGFIGCEPYRNGVAALLSQVPADRVDRLRVFPDDARALFPGLAAASLDRIYVLFSDPWPKRRHHSRRFIAPDTLAEMARLLADGGHMYFASDSADYVRWTLRLVLSHDAYAWDARAAVDWRRPPRGWVGTRYEAKARGRGDPCYYLKFRRANRPTPP